MMEVSFRRTKMAGTLPVLIPDQNRGAMRVGVVNPMVKLTVSRGLLSQTDRIKDLIVHSKV